jgi:EAL domain-containing protein (putative c-di-GMP-specific phosphodiesterase class I)
METLIRLADDHELPLRPFEILRAAKDSGLLGQVDMHVLTQACATIAQWTTIAPELVMMLNLHIKQFRDPKLTMAVAHATKRVGLSTENLGFEVDQSILADMNEAFEITQRLQGMGVKIYIEAFQGSAGAIKKVKELQPDGVKLDRLLVAALDEPWGRALVEPIVRALVDDDIEVTAVGVATHGQLDQLRDMGCHRVQGYLFAPPLPAALAQAILLDNRRKPVPTSLL